MKNKLTLLNQLLPKLTEPQKIWLSGYLSARPIGKWGNRGTSVAVLEAPEKLVQVEVNIEGSDHFIWFTNGERTSFGGNSFEKPACGRIFM